MKRYLLYLLLLIAGCQTENPVQRWSIYQVQQDGTDLKVLIDKADITYWGAAVSPDGSKIAVSVFETQHEGVLSLWDVSSGEFTTLTSNGRNNYFPAWSPDGRRIAYISQQADNSSTAEIYTIRADGTDETRLTENDAWEYGVSWSPDGIQLAFGSERGGEWQIYIMDMDTGETHTLATPQHGNSPSWSPDGASIAFTSNRDGDDEIYVSRTDGSELTNLTDNTDWDDNPFWSPDGLSIAFTSYRNEQTGIYRMNADGTEQINLTAGLEMSVGFSTWWPDGSQLLFHASKD